MQISEIAKLSKSYFGKNRKKLKSLLMNYVFDGRHYKIWKKKMQSLTSQPFNVAYGIFEDVADNLIAKNYEEIDWKWLGDLSWEFKILLNDGIEKGFDWDTKLALKCNGTARILQIYVSEIVPCFVTDVYYMTYNKKENYYEFGPINDLDERENEIFQSAVKFFKNEGFTYLSKQTSSKKFKELYSDCNEGNASLFDVLFSDTDNYQTEIKRFNDKEVKDYNDLKVNWTEFYDKNGNLLKREEYKYFPSNNNLFIKTNGLGEITEIRVRKDIKNHPFCEFRLDLLKEERKKLRKEQAKKN